MSTVGLFAIWGFAHRVYEAIAPRFASFFQLTGAEAALSQSVFIVAFFALAIPAALFLRRFGYKLGVVFGLSSFSVGALLLYPAIAQHEYLYFLGAVIVLGAGWAWLETSANPLIVALGSPDTAVRRLNFAQAFYPIGAVAGYEAGKWLAHMDLSLPAGRLTQAVVRPYVIVGLCVLFVAFLIENIEFPPAATEHSGKASRARDEFRTLLSRPVFRTGMAALASYIFAHTALWVFIIGYVRVAIPEGISIGAADFMLFILIVYGIGRIAGTALMYWFDPNKLLAVCAGMSLLLTATAVVTGGRIGVFCLVSTNFFMSIMFPTVFANSVRDLGRLTKAASGLLVTGMGIAAALVPYAMGLVAGVAGIRLAFILPSLCFGFVLLYAQAVRRKQSAATSTEGPARFAQQQ